LSDDNVRRIRRQNSRKISVIIGNPPYNANQLNENENNKNREYPEIDKRIKETYVEESTAQKTKLYDMYARFFRWASDRVDENGIIAFVNNSSFIDGRTFDGFRKVVAEEFNEIWIVDLKGNARTSGERRRREGGNVFDDQIRVGVAVWFCVKKRGMKGCRIFYEAVRDYAKGDEKREFLKAKQLGEREFDEVRPDAKHNWIKQANNDFENLLPLVNKKTKLSVKVSDENSIFKLYSLGIVTNRDDWAYDDDDRSLAKKIKFFCNAYESEAQRWQAAGSPGATGEFVNRKIKWTSELESHMKRGTKIAYDSSRILHSLYRPFVRRWTYFAPVITHRPYQNFALFPPDGSKNLGLSFAVEERSDFGIIATDRLPNKDMFIPSAAQVVCRWRYEDDGRRTENVTDWAVNQFRKHYELGSGKKGLVITKEGIFHYVYGVLHDPIYREKYAINLKREFPRIPFYKDFWRWAEWGKELMDLHIGYESVTPAKLKRIDVPDEKAHKVGLAPKCILKADKDGGRIVVDSETALTDIPSEAWDYRLGNRSALEWILDQYKEKKPKDPTIREKFNTYRFADYKENVIDLLMRVTTVSVKTVAIVTSMKDVHR
jgi:predicted helicase